MAISGFLILLQKGDKSSNQDDWLTPASPTPIYSCLEEYLVIFSVAEEIILDTDGLSAGSSYL